MACFFFVFFFHLRVIWVSMISLRDVCVHCAPQTEFQGCSRRLEQFVKESVILIGGIALGLCGIQVK